MIFTVWKKIIPEIARAAHAKFVKIFCEKIEILSPVVFELCFRKNLLSKLSNLSSLVG